MDVVSRPPRASDVDAVLAIHADPATNSHNPAGPMPDLAAAGRLLSTWLDDWLTHRIGYRVLEREDDGTVVGFVGVRRLTVAGRPLFNLYYRLAPVAWGQGIAGRQAAAAVAEANRRWAQIPVMARAQPSNLASQRIARAAGLDAVGHDPDGRVVLADRPLEAELLEALPASRPGG